MQHTRCGPKKHAKASKRVPNDQIHSSCDALAFLLAVFSFAQEFAWDALPEQMRKPIPDAVQYRLFLEHVSAF
jgi:hypothetical protein